MRQLKTLFHRFSKQLKYVAPMISLASVAPINPINSKQLGINTDPNQFKDIHRITEKFDDIQQTTWMGDIVKVCNNGTMVETIYDQWKEDYGMVYGSNMISATGNKMYIWKLRNISPGDGHNMYIGIDAGYKNFNYQFKGNANDAPFYIYNCDGYLTSWNGEIEVEYKDKEMPRWNHEGDILTMKLRFTEDSDVGTLSIQINDSDEWKFDVVKGENLQYKLLINVIGWSYYSIELLDCYECTN
eukprot:325568_1